MSNDYRKLRIVFMGTPEFAVASLQKLVEANGNIVGVVTAPDKPAGRGMQLQQSAVKQFAVEQGLTVLQPEKLKHPDFLEQLKALQPDLFIVVAFRMLPEVVWNMPLMGTVNLHGSLLPQYRGAAPINWAVINGEAQTGVTTFKLKHEIDTGNVLLKKTIDITDEDTAGTLHDKMKMIGAELLLETVKGLAEGNVSETIQENLITDHASLRHAPKIFTETCQINWQKKCVEIRNLIRGLSPYPGAFTEWQGKKLKIFSADLEIITLNTPPGSVETDQKSYLRIATTDGYLYLKDIQLEGKKRMKTEDFLRGYRFG
jgi:methionyl-tRNA formyltransferase